MNTRHLPCHGAPKSFGLRSHRPAITSSLTFSPIWTLRKEFHSYSSAPQFLISWLNIPCPALAGFNMFKNMSHETKRDFGQRNTGRVWRVWLIAAKASSAYRADDVTRREKEDGDHDRRNQRP